MVSGPFLVTSSFERSIPQRATKPFPLVSYLVPYSSVMKIMRRVQTHETSRWEHSLREVIEILLMPGTVIPPGWALLFILLEGKVNVRWFGPSYSSVPLKVPAHILWVGLKRLRCPWYQNKGSLHCQDLRFYILGSPGLHHLADMWLNTNLSGLC